MALEVYPYQSDEDWDYPPGVTFTGTSQELRALVKFLNSRIAEGGDGSDHVLRSSGRELWEVRVKVTDEE